MSLLQSFSRPAAAASLAVLLSLNVATAQEKAQDKAFEPQVNQEGKDVVWWPTAQTLVDKMLDIAKVTAKDTLFDLGSGDGRTVITAAKRGATADGIEYNPDMVELSKRTPTRKVSPARPVSDAPICSRSTSPRATVVTLFLLPELNVRLRPRILRDEAGHALSCPTPSRWATGRRTRRRPAATAAPRIAAPSCGSFPPRSRARRRCRTVSSRWSRRTRI